MRTRLPSWIFLKQLRLLTKAAETTKDKLKENSISRRQQYWHLDVLMSEVDDIF